MLAAGSQRREDQERGFLHAPLDHLSSIYSSTEP